MNRNDKKQNSPPPAPGMVPESAKRQKKRERQERVVFLKKVRSASSDRAPVTKKTKAYYRFAKKYPGKTDADGFRINEKETSGKKKFAVAAGILLCVAFFFAGAFAMKTGIILSKLPAENASAEYSYEKSEYIISFNYGKWTSSSHKKLFDEWKKKGVTGLIITLKKPDGILPFDPEGKEIAAIVNELNEGGFDTIGYISCLKDTSYCNSFPGRAVQIKNSGGATLYSNGYAYINPFSDEGAEYVADIIEKTAKLNFTYFLLDEISLPVGSGKKAPYYEGYTGAKNELNTRLNFLERKFAKLAGIERVIFMTDVYGFYQTENVAGTRYEGRLFPVTCRLRALDARISHQNTGGRDELGIIAYIETVPSVFLLEAAAEAVRETREDIPLYAVCDSEDDIQYLKSAGINKIIVTGGK